MSGGQLEESEPVFGLFAPADFETASFGQPSQCPFDDPTPGWKTHFSWNWTFLNLGFISSTTMLDMRHIAFGFDKLENVRRIISLISTEMLLRIGSLLDDMHHQIIDRPFVMFIRTRDVDRQGSTALIHQKMNFRSRFGAIRRILASFTPSQGCWNHFAVHRLPFPADFHLSGVIVNHHFEQLIENASLLPGLKSLVQGAARHLEPFPFDRFPLASAPQNIPDAVDHIPIVHPRSSWSIPLPTFGKMLLEFFPQLGRQLMEVNGSGFCVILVHGDAFPENFCFGELSFIR